MQATGKPSRIFLVFLFLASAMSAQTPPAQNHDQAIIIEQRIVRHLFNNDGTGMHTVEMRTKVVSAAGVQALGQLAFGYDADSEQLTVDYVRVRKPDGRVIETSLENAPEISLQIARDSPVYTDYREKHISVAALSPGDTVEYKITTKLLHPLAKEQFWLSYSFNKFAQVDDERLMVEVPKGRELKIKSSLPYAAEETAITRILTWKTSNQPKDTSKKSGEKKKTDEQAEPAGPDVQLSTFRSWQEVAGWYAGLLKGRTEPDPEVKAKAAELTRGAADNSEKARRLYSFVSQNIRYVSLSFGIGRFQPHFPAEVLHNGYGDCKDKHTLLAALLQGAGIGSQAVLIDSHDDLDAEVPSPSQFDHLFTAADVDGKRVWLDSTSGAAPYGLIFNRLRDRQALLIAPDLSDPLVVTPEVAAVDSAESMEIDGHFDEVGNFEADISTSLEGEKALVLRLAARRTAQADWNKLGQTMSYLSGFAGDVSATKIENAESPEMPLKISWHYSRKLYFQHYEGGGISGRNTLPLPPIVKNDISEMKRKGKIRVEGPDHSHQKARLRFAPGLHPIAPVSISVKRDYGEYASVYELKGDELLAERTLTTVAPSLPLAREKDLQAFLSAVNQDTSQQITVWLSPGAVAAEIENSNDAEKLDAAARARVFVTDYKGAEQFALRAVKADPQSAIAWNTLGNIYMEQGKNPEAESAFRKQIEINPYDEYAWNNLGLLLRKLNRKDEAVAAFRRQIEIVPLDRQAHKNLAISLLDMKGSGNKEAFAELEKAAQIAPDDKELKIALAGAYRATGQADKANALVVTLGSDWRVSLPGADLYVRAFSETDSPESAQQTAREALQRIEQNFQLNEPGDRGHGTASAVSALWASIGWAMFRDNRLEDAERYLHAAWTTSQSSAVALRLAKVYEKEDKKALAMQTLAEGLGGEGSKDGLHDNLVRLAGSSAKADAMMETARPTLSTQRSVILNRSSTQDGSASLLLVFSHGASPDKVTFTQGSSSLVEPYETEIKAQKFPVVYPDETPQHIVREAVMFCGAGGCSVVLVPPSSKQSTTNLGPLTIVK